jgi:hypothetical protein
MWPRDLGHKREAARVNASKRSAVNFSFPVRMDSAQRPLGVAGWCQPAASIAVGPDDDRLARRHRHDPSSVELSVRPICGG